MKYEGVIGSYSFQMLEEDVIEVWGYDNERPETFIYVNKGSIRSQKDFDTEISYFFLNNLG